MLDAPRLPSLHGERVHLRWPLHRDAADFFTIFSNPDVMRFWSRPPMTDLAEAQALVASIHTHFTAHTLYQWAIERQGRVIGHVTLADLNWSNQTAEIGFALARDVWGQGLAQEAASLVLDLAFKQLRLRRVEADVDPRNTASVKLLRRLGFVHEGLARERWYVGGVVQDSAIMGLLRRDWQDSTD